MEKTVQVKFLEEALDGEIRARLLGQVDYMLLTNRSMQAKNLNDPIFAKQTEAKQINEVRDGRIHYIRELIEDVKNGKFVV